MNINTHTLLLSMCLFLGNTTHTEVPFTWMKNLYAITGLEYEQLSPINGMVWSEQRIVENMYRYGNPDDATIKLIKEIFYLQADNVSFRPTILKSKPASYWTPHNIGAIIRAITVYRANKAQASEKDTNLIITLEAIIQPQKIAMQKIQKDMAMRIAEIKITIDDIAQQNKIFLSLIRQTQRKKITTTQEAEEKITELAQLEEKQKFLTNKRKPLDEELKKLTYHSKAIDEALQTGITKLISYFNQSIKESAPNKTQIYVSYTTEQILLTLLWKIANPRDTAQPKQDFIDYFNELDTLINTKNLKTWTIANPYSKQNYEQFNKQLATIHKTKLAGFMLENYEKTILAVKGYSVWESPLPPIISGAQVTYIHPDGKQTKPFSDCVETAFRNFFNIVLYDGITSSFNINRLIDTAQKDTTPIALQPSKNLINFYHKYPNVINLQASELYNSWTQVIENLPDVVYVEPTEFAQKERFYNVKSSLPNMLKICNHILFGNNLKFEQFSKEEQLDFVCQKLSHDDFSLTWEIADSSAEKNKLAKTKYTTLNFWINDTITFEWQLKKGHSVIPQMNTVSYPRKEISANSLMPMLNYQVPLLLKDYTLMALFTLNQEQPNVNFIFLQALDESQAKIEIINKLSELAAYNQPLQAVITQLMKSLAQSEFDHDAAHDMADLIWGNLARSLSPFYKVAHETLKNMQSQLVNGYVINHIIEDKSDYWYGMAKQKFETLTDEAVLSDVIESVINNKLDDWYGIAKQKFGILTDSYELSKVIVTVINNKLKDWNEIAQQKFQTMQEDEVIVINEEDSEEDQYPVVNVLNAVLENDKSYEWNTAVENKLKTMTDDDTLTATILLIMNYKKYQWYHIAMQKFEKIQDTDNLTRIINVIIDYKITEWYKIALKKSKEMGEETPLYKNMKSLFDKYYNFKGL